MPGYQPLVSSDPEEQRLREQWHRLRRLSTSPGSTYDERQAFEVADAQLSKYIWDRAAAIVEADRRKHPKAKRNQGVPNGVIGEGRSLP